MGFLREIPTVVKGTVIALLVLGGGAIGGLVAAAPGHAPAKPAAVRLVQRAATTSPTTTTTAPASTPATTAPSGTAAATGGAPATPAATPAPAGASAPTATTSPPTTAPAMVTVPNVVGMTRAPAQAAIQAAGFIWVWACSSSFSAPVSTQSPKAGQLAQAGTPVELCS